MKICNKCNISKRFYRFKNENDHICAKCKNTFRIKCIICFINKKEISFKKYINICDKCIKKYKRKAFKMENNKKIEELKIEIINRESNIEVDKNINNKDLQIFDTDILNKLKKELNKSDEACKFLDLTIKNMENLYGLDVTLEALNKLKSELNDINLN